MPENGPYDKPEERLREAEAHLWAMVVHFGGRGYSPHVQRDVSAASRYVNEHLAEQDMTARHRAILEERK
jgi:hypothetical protein